MIDIENIIFTRLAQRLRTEFSGISVYGEYVETPSAFPCVTIEERNNSVHERTRDLDGIEHNAELLYEINIYANNASAKKSTAKAIASVIDEEMSAMLFTRTFKNPIPNVDRTIYRLILRYKAVVHEGIDIDGTTVYQMHTTR